MKRIWKQPDYLTGILAALFAVVVVGGSLFYFSSLSRGELATSESFTIQSDVVSSGGTAESSVSYKNSDSIGQNAVGSAESPSFLNFWGFFNDTNNSSPETPTDLAQYRGDGTTTIEAGRWINSTTAVLKFNMYDRDGSDTLTPQVEIRSTLESFTGTETNSGDDVDFIGSTVEGSVTLSGLSSGTAYHWRARAKDSGALYGPWEAFGGNLEDEIDLGVDVTSPAVSILTPSSGEMVYGGVNFDITWIITEEGGSGLTAEPVSIYYTTNEGSVWTLLASGEETGPYVWNVPIINVSRCYVSLEAADLAGNMGRAVSSFEIFSYGWVKGTVTLSGEADNSKALVEAFIRGKAYGTTESATDGSYTIRVVTGTYSVEARKAGYLTGVYQGPIHVASGTTVESVNVSMPKGWPQYHLDQHLTGNSPHRQMQLPLSMKWVYNWSQIEGSPSFAEGKVFAVGYWGEIRAINASDGTLAWSYTPSGNPQSGSTPCYYDGRIYYATSPNLICLRASDGAFLWSDPNLYNAWKCSPVAHRGVVYVGRSGGGYGQYRAYDAYSGSLLWSHVLLYDLSVSTAALEGDHLYVESHTSAAGSGILYDLDPATGARRWSYNKGGISERGVAYSNNRIFGIDSGSGGYGRIFCAKTNGTGMYWSINTGSESGDWYHIPAVSGETVYVGSANGIFYSIKASDGSINWSYDFASRVNCSPAVENGMVFITTQSNTLCAISADDGTLLWSYQVSAAQFENTSPIVMNGALYASSYHSKLYAFYTNSTPEADAATLDQFRSNGLTQIQTGEWTNQSTVVFRMNATDPDYSDIFYLQVELKPISEAFDATGLRTGEGSAWTRGGNSIPVVCTIEGIADSAAGYHWRARVIDQYNYPTPWYAFGGNAEDENDFRVDANPPQVTVMAPSGPSVVRGGATYEVKWIATEEGGSGFATDPITLYYSVNNGISWELAASNEVNDGSYIWSVPAINSLNCHITIEAIDNVGNIGRAVSGKFSIYDHGWLNGTITLSGQSDHSNSTVVAYQNYKFADSTTTDASGHYSLFLPSGTYEIEALKCGYEQRSFGSIEAVSDGASTESIDLTLSRAWPTFGQDRWHTGNSPDTMLTAPLAPRWIKYYAGSPAVVEDGVVYSGGGGKYYAMNSDDGSIKWSIAVNPSGYGEVVNGRVYIPTDGNLYAVSAETGSILWSYYAGGEVRTTPALAGGVVYFGIHDGPQMGRFIAARESDGAVLWSYDCPNPYSSIWSSPVYQNGTVYFGTYVSSGENSGRLYALDANNNGALKWSFDPGYWVWGSPAISNGIVYFGTPGGGGNAYALNAENGAVLWSYHTADVRNAPAVGSDGVYFFGDYSPTVFKFDKQSGSLLWSVSFYNDGSSDFASPVIANGVVYVMTGDSAHTYAEGFSESDGHRVFKYLITAESNSSFSVADGKAYSGFNISYSTGLIQWENNKDPDIPTQLNQYRSDAVTQVATGDWASSQVVLKFSMSDQNNYDWLYPEVEVKLTGEAFNGTVTATGAAIAYTGSAVTGVVTVEGLGGGRYHWRARVMDTGWWRSSWQAFGGNAETDTDFRIDALSPNITVLRPLASEGVNGGLTYEIQWIATDEGGGGFTAAPITLYNSTNGGASWELLSSGEANDGSYIWNVPTLLSYNCLISIEAIDAVGNIGRAKSGTFTIWNMGTISGTVTLSGESDYSDAYLELSQDGGYIAKTTTAADGSYYFQNITSGAYYVEVEKPGFELKAVSVEVTSGHTFEADFALRTGWYRFKQDRWGSSYSPSTLVPPLALLWSHDSGYDIDNQSISVGDAVYDHGYISAQHTSDGSLKWNSGEFAGMGTANAKLVYKGMLYAVVGNQLQKYNAETGQHIGDLTLGTNSSSFSPVAAYNTIFVGSENYKMFAVDPDNLSIRWSIVSTANFRSSPVIVEGRVYFGSDDYKLYAVNSKTGSVEWSYASNGAIYASPMYYDGRIYFCSMMGNSSRVYSVNAADGSFVWSYPAGVVIYPSPAVAYDKVYFGAHDGKVRALSADTGEFVWERYINTGAGLNNIHSSPAVANGVVYVGSINNKLYALDANDGSILWTYVTGGPIAYASASINGDKLFIGSRDNYLYAFGPDIIPPSVPASFDAVALPSLSPTYVRLTWLESDDGDGGTGVNGYNIYRSCTSLEGYAKINSALVTGTSTNDSTVVNGNDYYYKVTAVDRAGNESGLSLQASAPNLLITKTMSVEAPTSGGYSGGANDAVPGATITYNITYSNAGFAPTTSVVMVDRVPDFTEYEMASATGEAVSTILFSNDSGASYTYSPSGTYVDPAVTNVKWLCNDLSVDHSSTVKFKVVIK